MYAKVVPRRKMMRRAMDQMFQVLIHEAHKFNGASEILDILASIISGYAVPLREEHIKFFNNIILPLHKVQTNPQFFEQLLRCTMLYLTKDRSLAVPLLDALLKYWPFANTEKEILYLTELREVLEVIDLTEIKPLVPKLFKRMIRCIAGENMHVCDRAMCYFENEYFLNIVRVYKDEVFPIMAPKINELAENHWQRLL
jgi:serine/threonine-protein phosphatase 2A regulatory subunit B'